MSGSVIEAMSRAPFAKISSPQPQKAAQTPSGPTPEMTSVAVGATAVVTAAAALIFGRKALSKALVSPSQKR